MIELLLLIIGLVVIWKYSGSLNAGAIASEQAAKVWAEEIISESVIERQELIQQFEKQIQTKGITEIRSSDDFLKLMKVK